ncbi:Uncharacterised protein [Bordetella pertussis]|nr:Uncharacterised protein [Bordetella pertussis]CFW38588.1 Uncharacterised protein [Bordetella pertussis]
MRCHCGSTASDLTVSMPLTVSTRKAWFSAPRLNLTSRRRRSTGVSTSDRRK